MDVRLSPNKRLAEEEGRVLTEMPMVQQCYTWDCGLACLSMVLQYYGASSSEVYTKDLDHQQCGESVWTIDLAYMLARYGIPHHLCTVTLGANMDHARKSFYKSFSKDEERINHLFGDAASNGVSVEKRSVALEELMEHLSQGRVAIILVDWNQMDCLWCNHSLIQRACMCCIEMVNSGYAGHFIVLCGFDRRKGVIFFKNPNAFEDLCCCRFECLERARKANGTDEDILFVYPKETTHTVCTSGQPEPQHGSLVDPQ